MLTIGNLLENEREKKEYTLQHVEKKTKIRSKNLEAIEKDDWQKFHSKTYIIGIIRSYAKFLKIDQEKLLAIFRREYEQKEEVKYKTNIPQKHFTPYIQYVFKVIIILLVCIFVLYFGYQLKLYFSSPVVVILSPKQTAFKHENKIELIGKIDKESIVTVNGERVYQNKENIFRIFIPLTQKKNIVTIEITGMNGKKTVVKKIFKKI